jgi:hypothetical protein
MSWARWLRVRLDNEIADGVDTCPGAGHEDDVVGVDACLVGGGVADDRGAVAVAEHHVV